MSRLRQKKVLKLVGQSVLLIFMILGGMFGFGHVGLADKVEKVKSEQNTGRGRYMVGFLLDRTRSPEPQT